MFNKKAQSQIITTVLIILLVLAAVVIVWQVVQTTVEDSSSEITATTACVGVIINPVSAHRETVTITRDSGGTSDKVGWVILIDGISTVTSNEDNSEDLGQLESGEAFITSLQPTAKIEVAGKIGDIICSPGSSVIVNEIS